VVGGLKFGSLKLEDNILPMESSFKNLEVWQSAMNLAEAAYAATTAFPKAELYGLTSQIRRAAVSVPVNIAEGSGRRTNADFSQFLHIAAGSLRELETCLLLAQRLGYLPDVAELLALVEKVGRMNTRLRQSLHGKPRNDA